MRNLIVSEFVTVDGVMAAPEKWSVFSYWDEDFGRFKDDGLFASGALGAEEREDPFEES